MPYHFTCPFCGSATLVDDEFSGQSGPCVACGKTIQIPAFATADSKSPQGRTVFQSLGKTTQWVVGGVIFLMLIAFAITLVRVGSNAAMVAQAASQRARCMSNLQKIAAALNAYADDHKRYPPPYTTDDKGVPLLSWRVLILPYLDEQALFAQFKMNAPWDDPDNLNLMYQMPEVFSSPASPGSYGDTTYVLITGPGTLFPPSGPLSPGDVLDVPSETLLVVETARPPGTTTQWTKPYDLDVTRMTMAIGASPGVEIGGTHQGGATAATVDERGHFLSDKLTPTVIKALISPQGGEAVPDDAID